MRQKTYGKTSKNRWQHLSDGCRRSTYTPTTPYSLQGKVCLGSEPVGESPSRQPRYIQEKEIDYTFAGNPTLTTDNTTRLDDRKDDIQSSFQGKGRASTNERTANF